MSPGGGSVRLAKLHHPVTALGPGVRAGIWFQGCTLACPGCLSRDTWEADESRRVPVSSVLEWLAGLPELDGVTISGGEPMCQLEFTRALLQASREHGLHTALESNLCFPWEITQRALEQCRLLMCDLKLWDREGHRRWTGAYNDHTKQNIQNAAELGIPVLLRTPVVPGVNDREDEIAAIARFAAGIPTLICYELLPYHPLGLAKGKLEHGFEPQAFEKPTAARMEELAWAADRAGVPVRIAGKAFNFGPQQESEGTA